MKAPSPGTRVRRRAGASRTGVLALILTLAAAVAVLLALRSRSGPADLALGGPLLPVARGDVTGLLLTHGGAQYRLDRDPVGRWSLSGAIGDYLDQQAVGRLLDDLLAARGGPLLAGTEPGDRRYEFNGPDALRLTVFSADRDPVSLGLGTFNPVTGRFYATGAGRAACFTVEAGLRERLARLPGSVQLKTLLPVIPLEALTGLVLERNGKPAVFARRDGRWWLKRGPDGLTRLDPLAERYQRFYGDRRRDDADGSWILVSDAALGTQVYEVSEVVVRQILPPEAAPGYAEAWGLDDPWRRVVLTGPGLDPDPAAGDPDRMVIDFGELLDDQVIPARRRGVVLLADGEAARTLDQPLEIFVHRTALTERAVEAAGLVLAREGVTVLEGTRRREPATGDGRELWTTTVPASGATGMEESRRAALAGELVIDLDRLEVLAVLPPVADPDILEETDRVRLTLEHDEGGETVFELGYLRTDRLDAAAMGSLETSGGRPAAIRRPDTGRLLQISDSLIVTARNLGRQ
ncbi:MAG: hypothetical protein AB7V45_07970 [Candidatus Krumholzibacteriia bacterium]